MAQSTTALQTAIFTVLSADAQLKTILGDPPRILDFVPQQTVFPYITIGDIQTHDWSTATETGEDHRIVIHSFSRYNGRKESREIEKRLCELLHDAALPLAGHTLIRMHFLVSDILPEADGRTYHGLTRFRAITEPA